jgi:hypothetical protein
LKILNIFYLMRYLQTCLSNRKKLFVIVHILTFHVSIKTVRLLLLISQALKSISIKSWQVLWSVVSGMSIWRQFDRVGGRPVKEFPQFAEPAQLADDDSRHFGSKKGCQICLSIAYKNSKNVPKIPNFHIIYRWP